MDFNVPDRVHIMPVGYEEQRVYKCATKLKADKAVLIGHEEDGEEDEERMETISTKLEENAIEVERTDCDLFDLYDSLGRIAEIITKFEGDDIYVNVSTGSKITAIAGMIACMAINATPYYASAKDYSTEYPEGVEFIEELPRYPIDEPERQQIEMLYVIDEMENRGTNATKGKLIHVGQHLNMPFVKERGAQGEKANYRLLDKKIIEPMTREGYITTDRDGRHKLVELTNDGKNALRAFQYLVQESHQEKFEEVYNSRLS